MTMAVEIMVVVAAPASLTLTTGWCGAIIRTTFATIRLRTATIYIDIADKSTVAPRQRTIEIVGTDVDFPLAIVEEIAQSDVAVAPTPRVKVVIGVDATQITVVDFVHPVVFSGRKSQLPCHLIGQITGFGTCFPAIHSGSLQCDCHGHSYHKYQSFHHNNRC